MGETANVGAIEAAGAGAPPRIAVLCAPPPEPELVELLGARREARLRGLLRERAEAWARAAFGREVESAADLPAALAVAGAEDALVAVRPVLSAWPVELACAALGDLAAGCVASVGALQDGGIYLLAIAEGAAAAGHELLTVDLGARDVLGPLFGAAARAEAEVGLLRVERGMRSPADVRALRADPMTDQELRALLR